MASRTAATAPTPNLIPLHIYSWNFISMTTSYRAVGLWELPHACDDRGNRAGSAASRRTWESAPTPPLNTRNSQPRCRSKSRFLEQLGTGVCGCGLSETTGVLKEVFSSVRWREGGFVKVLSVCTCGLRGNISMDFSLGIWNISRRTDRKNSTGKWRHLVMGQLFDLLASKVLEAAWRSGEIRHRSARSQSVRDVPFFLSSLVRTL